MLVGERVLGAPALGRAARAGAIDLVIDPGQAFGTGAHPDHAALPGAAAGRSSPRGPLADLGCGSGVLAIAAAKLGFDPVSALDNEPAAVEATRENARANGVELARVERFDLREQPAAARADRRREPGPAAAAERRRAACPSSPRR